MNSKSEWRLIQRMMAGDFDPDQPRDDLGRWTSTGGSGVGTAELSSEELDKLYARQGELASKGKLSEEEEAEFQSLMEKEAAHKQAKKERHAKMSPDEIYIERFGELNFKKDKGTLTQADLENAKTGEIILTKTGAFYKIDDPEADWSLHKGGHGFTDSKSLFNLLEGELAKNKAKNGKQGA